MSSDDEQPACLLAGDQLVDRLQVTADAVGNWARLTGRPADTLIATRMALLDELRAAGRLTCRPPAWMTSPKPGVDAWIELDSCVLSVTAADPDLNNGRPWRATNALASRRRPGRARQTVRPVQAPARFGDVQLRDLVTLNTADLLERVRCSEHCVTRMWERGLRERPPADLDMARGRLRELMDGGQARMVAVAPGWADAAGHGGPCVLFDFDGGLVALPAAPDVMREDGSVMLTSCLPQRWVAEDLLDLRGEQLAGRIRLTSQTVAAFAGADGPDGRERLRALIAADGRPRMRHGTVTVLTGHGLLQIRPAARVRPGDPSWVSSGWQPAV